MSKTVDINGVEIDVTPIHELPFPKSLTASVISSRIISKTEAGSRDDPAVGVDEDFYQLIEMCIEDRVRRRTIAALDAEQLNIILEVIFEDPDEVDDNV